MNDIVSPIETVPNSNKASFVNNNNTIVSNNNNISVKFNSKNSKGEEIKLEIHLRENSVKEEQKANKVEPIIVSNFNNNNTINFNDIVVTERPQLSTTLEQSQTSKKVEETQKESTLKEELEIKRQKLFNKLENLKNNLNMPLAREENSNLVNIESKINKNKSGAFKPSKSVMDKAKLLQDHLLGENLEENNNGPIIEQPIVNDKPVIQKKKMKAPILNLN